MHLLLVDDEAAFREVIGERLAEHGFRVEQAGTGEEAVERLNDFAFDVLITDLFLTDLHGPDVATRLRDLWPDLQVVFLSDGHGPVAESMDDVPLVTKPFTARALATAMTRVTATRRAA